MSNLNSRTVRPEPVEGLSFSEAGGPEEGQGFYKLSLNGFVKLRQDFPGLANNWHYLDTGASAQKPQAMQ